MFDINNIQFNQTSKQWTCVCSCSSPSDAEYRCAKHIMIPKGFDTIGEIYFRGSNAIIGASSKQAATNIAMYINGMSFLPLLDVCVFYGSSRKGLFGRWCVGFNYPDSGRLIDFLNTHNRMIVTDKDSKSWQDVNGSSYSVVMLTGVLEPHPEDSTELKTRVNQCLNSIETATFRKLNPVIIK